jgi:hypothetical protein
VALVRERTIPNRYYRPSDRHLSAKLVLTFADRGWHVVRAADPYGCILGFLDRSCCSTRNFKSKLMKYFRRQFIPFCTETADVLSRPLSTSTRHRQLLNRIGNNGGNAISCDERGMEPWNSVQIEQGISYKFQFSWDIRTVPSKWLPGACDMNRREIVASWSVRLDVWINQWRIFTFNSKMYKSRSEILSSVSLWPSGQSSWLQIQRSGFDCQIFLEVVGLERDLLSLVSTIEGL